jgi:hypothetical protein
MPKRGSNPAYLLSSLSGAGLVASVLLLAQLEAGPEERDRT